MNMNHIASDTGFIPDPWLPLTEWFVPFIIDYRQQAREELLNHRSIGMRGFRDNYGYIIDYDNSLPTTLGEATLHTAIAVVGIATGNYSEDDWEKTFANEKLKELLNTLLILSWGNKDMEGQVHPIRHPSYNEYDAHNSRIRNSPLSKDSFGAIVAAAYYSYTCPNSDVNVCSLAQRLISKWADYLLKHQWKTHSNYISGEFVSEEIDGKQYYKNIFSETGGRVMFKGPEAFILLPHERYALRNVASLMGIPTIHWDLWSISMSEELKQAVIDNIPYVADIASRSFDQMLNTLVYEMPYSVQLGPADLETRESGRGFPCRSTTRRAGFSFAIV
ncbi:hypothetical protein [Paenibacillus fonticola]|uniref:hypothetical protein n=1 Tax=Paenibacillus fonticola TaxID=379896 RepID=UPI0003649F89|nr:hypothetical protein [Paenibacillus fonticola]